jgi:uncharacterized phage protein (TIGR02218 family)
MKTSINYTSQDVIGYLGNIIANSKEATPVQMGYLYLFKDVTGGFYGFSDLGYDMNVYGTAAGSPFYYYGWMLTFTWPTIECRTGSEDSKAEITCFPCIDNPSVQPLGTRFISSFQQGLFDGQQFWIYQIFQRAHLDVIGLVIAYSGFIGECKIYRTKITIEGHSLLQFANIRVPKNMYQPACSHALYDAGCGVNPNLHYGGYLISAIDPNYPLQQLHVNNPYYPAGTFTQGFVRFQNGLNYGIQRTVKFDAGNAWFLIDPLPNVPAIGDLVYIYRGCDKSLSTCETVFSNSNHYRGFPYIPTETLFY